MAALEMDGGFSDFSSSTTEYTLVPFGSSDEPPTGSFESPAGGVFDSACSAFTDARVLSSSIELENSYCFHDLFSNATSSDEPPLRARSFSVVRSYYDAFDSEEPAGKRQRLNEDFEQLKIVTTPLKKEKVPNADQGFQS